MRFTVRISPEPPDAACEVVTKRALGCSLTFLVPQGGSIVSFDPAGKAGPREKYVFTVTLPVAPAKPRLGWHSFIIAFAMRWVQDSFTPVISDLMPHSGGTRTPPIADMNGLLVPSLELGPQSKIRLRLVHAGRDTWMRDWSGQCPRNPFFVLQVTDQAYTDNRLWAVWNALRIHRLIRHWGNFD